MSFLPRLRQEMVYTRVMQRQNLRMRYTRPLPLSTYNCPLTTVKSAFSSAGITVCAMR